MCGLPLFPPKPKQENPARARRKKEAHADRPVVRGEPLVDPASSQSTPAERSGLFPNAGGEP
jgi:hypothetical protein